jgi:hypothetical protein
MLSCSSADPGEQKLADVGREYDLNQSEVAGWMDVFVKGGERSLKARAEDELASCHLAATFRSRVLRAS